MNSLVFPEILLKHGKRICTSKDIQKLTGKNYLQTISRLTNARWLLPIQGFRGIYYVRDPEERLRSFLKLDSFSILALILNTALGAEWYFGRTSAMSLLGNMQQPVSVHYVLNRKKNRRINSPIFGRLALLKTSSKITSACGIINKKYKKIPYKVCTPERNASDYLYLHVHGHASIERVKYLTNQGADKNKLQKIIPSCYPKRSAKKMLSVLKGE